MASAIIAGLFALIGAWAGAAFALSRYKQEKAFDRRVQWYESISAALTRARHGFIDLTAALPDDATHSPITSLRTLERTLEQLAIEVSRGDMFAIAQSADVLDDIRAANSSFLASLGGLDLGRAVDRKKALFAACIALEEFAWATRRLAFDARRQLGYETLPRLTSEGGSDPAARIAEMRAQLAAIAGAE